MSNKLNNLLKGLKTLLTDTVNEKFEKVTIEGEEKQIDVVSREVGGDVNVIDADGVSTPVPNGEYELSDGFKFTVTDGKISEIAEDKPEDETPVEEALSDETVTEDAPAEPSESEKEIEALKAEIADLKKLIEELTKSSEDEFKKVKSDFDNQDALVNKLIDALKLIPTEFSKVDNTPKANNKKAQDLARLANAFKK